MRTAVSVSEVLFHAVERLARLSKRHRGEVYADPLREHVARRLQDEVTECPNRFLEVLEGSSQEELKAQSEVRCNLCRSEARSLVFGDRHADIVRCNICGLIYYHPQPTQADLAAYYSSQEADSYLDRLRTWYGRTRTVGANRGRAAGDHPFDPDFPARLRPELEAIARHLSEAARPRGQDSIRLLDVGCAYGALLVAAKELGWQPCGVEISKPMARWANDALSIPVVNGTISDAATILPPNTFHIITMSHVLEHTNDPAEAISYAVDLLRSGGVLAVMVPNVDSAQARENFDRWEWRSYPDHLFYFSPHTLRSLLSKAGLEVVRMSSRPGAGDEDWLRGRYGELEMNGRATVIDLFEPLLLLSELRAVAVKQGNHSAGGAWAPEKGRAAGLVLRGIESFRTEGLSGFLLRLSRVWVWVPRALGGSGRSR